MAGEAQSSSTVMLVRPSCFGFHPEAAASNAFAASAADGDIATAASAEFDRLAQALDRAGVKVLTLNDTADPAKPDAVFPNNWISFHGDGTIVVYPMATAARRLERNVDGLKALLASEGFEIRRVIDLSFHERHGHFLEGTGSLILDRPQRRAYASRSVRTDPQVIADFDDRLDYSTLIFDAHDHSRRPIYHTNVLLSLGSRFAVLCSEVVSEEYRQLLIDEIEASSRSVIEVDYEQLRHFACNVIELKGRGGDPVIALSAAARRSFSAEQLNRLESFGWLVDADIPTIEAVGGGSVRCMIADVHLPRVTPGS